MRARCARAETRRRVDAAQRRRHRQVCGRVARRRGGGARDRCCVRSNSRGLSAAAHERRDSHRRTPAHDASELRRRPRVTRLRRCARRHPLPRSPAAVPPASKSRCAHTKTKSRRQMRDSSTRDCPIAQINAERRKLSAIKGGKLRDRVRGRCVTLVYSDVSNGALADVASGPTITDASEAILIADNTTLTSDRRANHRRRCDCCSTHRSNATSKRPRTSSPVAHTQTGKSSSPEASRRSSCEATERAAAARELAVRFAAHQHRGRALRQLRWPRRQQRLGRDFPPIPPRPGRKRPDCRPRWRCRIRGTSPRKSVSRL